MRLEDPLRCRHKKFGSPPSGGASSNNKVSLHTRAASSVYVGRQVTREWRGHSRRKEFHSYSDPNKSRTSTCLTTLLFLDPALLKFLLSSPLERAIHADSAIIVLSPLSGVGGCRG